MKILYISSANVVGGGSLALLNIVRGVMAAGHEVMVACTNERGAFPEMLTDAGCQVVRCSHRLTVYPSTKNVLEYLPRLIKMVLDNRKGRRQLKQVMLDFRPDIVHTNVGPMDVAFDVCQQLGIKHVWHQREYQDLDFGLHFFPSIRTFMRKSHSKGNYNICITEGVFRHRNFRDGIDRVIYDGVFGRERANACVLQPVKQNYVLFAGRIEEAKGVLDLLRVFACFHEKYPDCQLKLAGRYKAESTYYQQCCEFVKRTGLSDVVEFLGECKDVYSLMAKARMMVVPSRFEGFGFITAEAMLNGCPVVGRDTAGTKEQMDKGLEYAHGEIALRFSSDNEMLEAMEHVMTHSTEAMCKRARETVLHLYTAEEHVRQVLDYYQWIAAQ